MDRVRVRAPGGAYEVLIGSGALRELPREIERARPSRLHLVTDRCVDRHHGARVRELLGELGVPLSRTVLPAGESSKSFASLELVVRDAIRAGADRRTLLIALGGGVVGDLTGYAAASLLRGVAFVQVPTTLLAMVDASVGGKTGINVPEGKNLVGAFHQPRAVVLDLELLSTLAERQIRAGWAEIIKTACIRDARFYARIEKDRELLLARDPARLREVVSRCVRIKASVVEEDEREGGLRMILNFGHTLAHGIEAAQDYGGFLHGEAVAIGMVFAAGLGERLGETPAGTADRIAGTLAAYGLPTSIVDARARGAGRRPRPLSAPEPSRILSAMSRDKKRGPGGMRWVLLEKLGAARIVEGVDPSRWRRELREFLGGVRST